ncbi:MAG: ISNCY family transposase [Myxococcales bacterium]
MSSREVDRLQVLVRVAEKRLTQREAARVLGLTERQVRRLVRAHRQEGARGLVSRKRGRQSNHRLPDELRELALELLREHYSDFGPTFAREKLTEVHGLSVSTSTLRTWMIDAGLWVPRSQRRRSVHQPRARRECYGELIQVDGSDHRWFEDRGPPCTLLVFIDDATGKLMELRFCESESTFSYFEAAQAYLKRHGKPVAFYSDKASVFRVNAKQAKGGVGHTQFGRAMAELNIDTMCANTQQAKGRVERANSTLQDRLVKELRLAGISVVAEANEFVPGFMEDFNRRFGRPALNPHDAHRPLRDDEALPSIFTWQETRKVSRSLTLHYKRVMYILDKTDAARRAMGHLVMIYETDDGEISIRHEGRELPARAFHKEGHVRQAAVVGQQGARGSAAARQAPPAPT